GGGGWGFVGGGQGGGGGVGDGSETAVAPEPLAAGEVGPERRALGVRSVAAGTWRARNLALVDAPAERDLFGRCSGRSRQRARRLRAGIRMDALRWNGRVRRRIIGSRGRHRCRGDRCRSRTAIRHAPNPPALVVGN